MRWFQVSSLPCWPTALLIGLAGCSSSSEDDSSSAPVRWQDCTFIAVGHGGTVACTRDGSSWSSLVVADTAEALSAVAADSAGNVVAVGHEGAILSSSDRGATWMLSEVLAGEALASVASDGARFVVGASPALLSTDGGATWTEGGRLDPEDDVGVAVGSMTSPGVDQFLAVGQAFRATAGVSARRRIYASTDGGISWAVVDDGEVQSAGSSLSDGYLDVATDGARAVAVGPGGLAKYADGPAFDAWEDAAGVTPETHLYAVAYDAASQRFVAGELEGALFVSPDGVSWSESCNESASNSISDIATRDGRVLAVGPGTVVVSDDGSDSCLAMMPESQGDVLVLLGAASLP